jgi:RIO-like serine/threonine protein kinase
MVMEKIEGESLISGENRKEKLELHIDEIYRLYNILYDKGYILGDLAARNIILSNDGKIYFIDFDPTYTQNTLQSVSLNKRLSKEKLLKTLIRELNGHSGGKKQTKKQRKSKNKNTKKHLTNYQKHSYKIYK